MQEKPKPTVDRNLPAEEQIRNWMFAAHMRRQPEGPLGVKLPPSPFERLKTQVSGATPETTRSIDRLMALINPGQGQVAEVTGTIPAKRRLSLEQQGINPLRSNLGGQFSLDKRQLYFDTDWPAQIQYETLLHELLHAADGTEQEARELERRYGFKGEGRRPPVSGGPVQSVRFKK